MTQKTTAAGCASAPRPDSADATVEQRPSISRVAHPGTPRILSSAELLGEHAMVFIQHQGEMYRLQSTRQGKLILTK